MYCIQHMTRPQVEERIRAYPVAILPIGSCEQHGPHLPLGTDTMLAEALAERLSDKTGALVFPSLNFGYSWVWRDIAGTLSLSTGCFQAVLADAVRSVERYGIRLLVFVNGHEANSASIKYALRDMQDQSSIKLLGMFYPGLHEVYDREMQSPTWGGMFHADEFETSLMLAVHPQHVNMSLAVEEYPARPPLYGVDTTSIGTLSQSGVYGNAKLASAEKGERMLAAFCEKATTLVEQAYTSLP